MEILLVAATPFEIMPVQEWLQAHFKTTEQGHFRKNEIGRAHV